jgi:hypothetical protein
LHSQPPPSDLTGLPPSLACYSVAAKARLNIAAALSAGMTSSSMCDNA